MSIYTGRYFEYYIIINDKSNGDREKFLYSVHCRFLISMGRSGSHGEQEINFRRWWLRARLLATRPCRHRAYTNNNNNNTRTVNWHAQTTSEFPPFRRTIEIGSFIFALRRHIYIILLIIIIYRRVHTGRIAKLWLLPLVAKVDKKQKNVFN